MAAIVLGAVWQFLFAFHPFPSVTPSESLSIQDSVWRFGSIFAILLHRLWLYHLSNCGNCIHQSSCSCNVSEQYVNSAYKFFGCGAQFRSKYRTFHSAEHKLFAKIFFWISVVMQCTYLSRIEPFKKANYAFGFTFGFTPELYSKFISVKKLLPTSVQTLKIAAGEGWRCRWLQWGFGTDSDRNSRPWPFFWALHFSFSPSAQCLCMSKWEKSPAPLADFKAFPAISLPYRFIFVESFSIDYLVSCRYCLLADIWAELIYWYFNCFSK